MKRTQLQTLALAVAVVLLSMKIGAWFMTHSNAILGDALESIVNVLAGAFGLYSLYLASLPKDTNHPYGHGKVEFIAAGLEGGLILLSGVFLIGKAVYSLFYPIEIHDLDTGMILIGITGLINFALGKYMADQGSQQNSMVLVSGGRHLLSDAYTSAGLIIGLLLVYLVKWNPIDSIVAIIFSLIIVFTGWKTLQESVSGIMDEADSILLGHMIEHLNEQRRAEWIDVHNMRVIRYGDALHFDCHITLPWYYDQRESHAAVKMFEDLVDAYTPATTELFVHTDPCLPDSCKICSVENCAARRYAFEKRITWNFDNVSLNRKHNLEQEA